MDDLESGIREAASEGAQNEAATDRPASPDLKSDTVPQVVINEQKKTDVKTEQAAREAKATQKETLEAIKKGERIALWIAAIVAVGTIGQWITTCTNNASSSRQTDRLISAANINACAARNIAAASKRNADAAEGFAASAGSINDGIGHAVEKLKTQSDQARRSANYAGKAWKASIDHFTLDERPYVIVTRIDPAKLAVGFPIQYNIFPVNYGRSPAIKVSTRAAIIAGPNAIKSADGYFLMANTVKTIGEAFTTVLPPGVPDNDHLGFSTIQTTPETLSPDGTLSLDQLDYILKNDFSIVVVGRITYSDISGGQYYTDFCFSRFITGATPNCSTHNEIH